MTQRRMPTGQGPARSAARPPAASGPRAASQRSRDRRVGDRGLRPDPHGPPSSAADDGRHTEDGSHGRRDAGRGRAGEKSKDKPKDKPSDRTRTTDRANTDRGNSDRANKDQANNDRASTGRANGDRDATARSRDVGDRIGRARVGLARSGGYRGSNHRGRDRGGIRRAAGPARRTKAPRRPRRISGRAAVLGALLIALAFAYAYPVRVYLEQQAQINALRTSQQQQRQRIQHLTDALAQWNDDDFVIAQARTRFQLVRKGELLYMLVPDPAATESGSQDHPPPWFDQLRANLHEIDSPPAG